MSEEYFNRNHMISIFGGRKHQRRSVADAALWVAENLFPKHKVEIDIELCKLNAGYLGFCWPTDDNNSRPREFSIQINKTVDAEAMISILMHEMVHVKQYVKNELQFRERPMAMRLWKGKIIDDEKVDYYDLPWEKEAYRLQDFLVQEYNK